MPEVSLFRALAGARLGDMDLLHPGDAGYDTERLGYNLSVDHRPAVIAPATAPDDVVAAVRYATDHDLAVTVQATGHGPTAPADGVLVSTTRMAGIRIDPDARTARFAAGVRSGALVAAAAEHGLAPLNGSAPGVGAVGYHLGGGVGMLGRQFGYAADHVRALEVVTADGQLRRVSAEQDPDLFWALRGAGKGRFGVVVAMEIDLHPVRSLYGGALVFGADATPAVLRTWADWTATTPETMGSSVLLLPGPDGRRTAHVRFADPGAAAEELVAPFRALGPLGGTVGEMAYREVGTIHAEPTTPVAFHSRNAMLRTLDPAAVDTLLDRATGPYLVELRHLGGALSRPPAVPNALGRRDGTYCLYTGGAGDAAVLRAAMADLHDAMTPWGTGGACLNFLAGPDVTAEEVRSAFRAPDLARLDAIGRHVDPDSRFVSAFGPAYRRTAEPAPR